jgi:hypothetical protein
MSERDETATASYVEAEILVESMPRTEAQHARYTAIRSSAVPRVTC